MKTKNENNGIFEVQPKHGTILNMAEHQHSEWKESWRDEYLKWICGFANADGGTLIVGKDDKGTIVGVKNAKKLMEDLPNKIKNMLGVLPEVNLKVENDLEYIEIHVEASTSPVSYQGKLYIRRGSTNQLLDGPALSDFILKKSNLEWDEVIYGGATLDDINEDTINLFKEYGIQAGRLPFLTQDTPTETILRNLRLMNEEGQLTRAALLLFGKDARNIEFTAYARIGKFGYSSSELLGQDDIEVNAFELADRTLEILDKKYLTKSISYEGLRRIEKPEYPYGAIREILFNAIIHRTYRATPITVRLYPDRIRIWNYGTLPDEITVEKLRGPHSSIPRNELLAKTFYKAGFIETWGRGTIKIIEECEKHGLPEPQIEEDQGGVAVTIFKDIYDEKYLSHYNLNERQKKAIQYIKEHGVITNPKYIEMFDVTRQTTIRDMDELQKLGFLKKESDVRPVRYVINVYGYEQK